MNVTIDLLIGVDECVKSARQTQRLSGGKTLSVDTWLNWLHAEHSPIRVMQLRVNMHDIPYYTAMHLVRHTQGITPFVSSQRDTAINPVDYDRRKAPQDALVDYCPVVNPQSLINISRRRLCTHADEVTRQIWGEVKKAIAAHDDPYVAAIAKVMMPDCDYRSGICHELKSCGYRQGWRGR